MATTRQYLLPEKGSFYKVNMHSHSTYSDGKTTPEEIKAAYKAAGYAAVAFTEHQGLLDFSHLTDDGFVAITSYEYDFNGDASPSCVAGQKKPLNFNFQECLHLNLYAKAPHNTKMVCFHPSSVRVPYMKEHISELEYVGDGNFHKVFSVECFNEIIRTAKENGFLVVYNHPTWSLNTYETYCGLEGLDGLEIVNGCTKASDLDYTPYVYDQMARAGKRMICVGGDDNHSPAGYFNAWTMVKADELTYGALIRGLERGDCYASTGPEIHDLYVEEDKVHIRCSHAQGIYLTTASRRKDCKLAGDGEPLIEAAFKVKPEDVFFRITVRDARGEHANTRIFWLDELEGFNA